MADYNYFEAGSYNFICETCKQKKKSSQLQVQWDNKVVCKNCYDSKHPFLEERPVVIDGLGVPLARPRPDAIFITNANDTTGSIWGTRYRVGYSYQDDVAWENWAEHWRGQQSVPFSSTEFPLR